MEMSATEDSINTGTEFQTNQDDIYDRFEMVIGSYDHLNQLSKHELMVQLFNDVFKLVPEAQKGSFYELADGEFELICSKGYDESLLSNLSVKVKDVFFISDPSVRSDIEAKQIRLKTLNGSVFDSETLEILNTLGVDDDYISLYCPVKVDGANVGIISLENIKNIEFSTISVKTLKFYSQLISNYLTMKTHQDQLTQLHLETVSALVSSIEVNDSYTEGHGKRVSFLCKTSGRKFGIAEKNNLKS